MTTAETKPAPGVLGWTAVAAALLVSIAGAVACLLFIVEHGVAPVGMWYVHYVVYAAPGGALGAAAGCTLSRVSGPPALRRALTTLAVIGLAPAVIAVAWLTWKSIAAWF